jgi:hypothetical protein
MIALALSPSGSKAKDVIVQNDCAGSVDRLQVILSIHHKCERIFTDYCEQDWAED